MGERQEEVRAGIDGKHKIPCFFFLPCPGDVVLWMKRKTDRRGGS